MFSSSCAERCKRDTDGMSCASFPAVHQRSFAVRTRHREAPGNLLIGAAAGALGGLLGAWVMVRVNHLIGPTESSSRGNEHHRRAASPNDTDGTFPDEPATMQAASRLTEAVAGQPLSEQGKQIGGPIIHYAFGAATGAFYGALAERQPGATAGGGLPFGAAVWLMADEMGVPLAGLSGNPLNYPLSRHASALASHLAFGLTVEGVRRLLLGPGSPA
jgi:putative membrane protein